VGAWVNPLPERKRRGERLTLKLLQEGNRCFFLMRIKEDLRSSGGKRRGRSIGGKNFIQKEKGENLDNTLLDGFQGKRRGGRRRRGGGSS